MNNDDSRLRNLYLESVGATFDATLGPHAAAPLQEPIMTRLDIEDEDEGEVDHSNDTIKAELYKISEYGPKLMELIDAVELDPWVQSKITVASTYISDVYHYIKYKADTGSCESEGGIDIEDIVSGLAGGQPEDVIEIQ